MSVTLAEIAWMPGKDLQRSPDTDVATMSMFPLDSLIDCAAW